MNALEITNLHKTYKNGVQALKGINLSVAEGDFFALLGPNGAGKSTAIGIVTSLVNKTDGDVKIFGHDLITEREQARACIGVVPQEFNFNVFEPIRSIMMNQAGYYGIPRSLAKERTETYLRELNLWGKRNENGRSLSGGMKRRLMIARALVHEPKLLILDEPTAGVDIEIRRSMWAFLQRINKQGTTIILTTHYLEEAESLCNNIAIINHGNIVEDTSMPKLLGKMHQQVFVLDLENELSETPAVAGCLCHLRDKHTLEVTLEQNQPINDVFTTLTQQNIAVRSMRNKVNRLESLFMDLITNDA